MRLIRYKNYSGYKIKGEDIVSPLAHSQTSHVVRMAILTARLEAPYWGGVQSYDGAGISGGILHHTAIYPHMKGMPQGVLWELLRRLEYGGNDYNCLDDIGRSLNDAVESFYDLLKTDNCYVAADGKLRDVNTGQLTKGYTIQALFSGPGGKVTSFTKDRAQRYIEALHTLLAHPAGRQIQLMYAVEWFVRGNAKDEEHMYRRLAGTKVSSPEVLWIESVFESPDPKHALAENKLEPFADLTACVYHAFSANAPGTARNVLKKVLATEAVGEDFAKRLIRAMGTSSYGAWKDQPGTSGRSRYDRTRYAASRLGYWDPKLLKEFLPVDL